MAQLRCPTDFVPLQQVTAANLNAHVNNSTLLPGAIEDQTALAANTVAAGDTVLLHDASASALRKATAGDILASGLPIATNLVVGATGLDIVVTPATGNKLDINGNAEVNDLNVTGNSTVAGNLTVTGAINGAINTSGNITSSGTANFTGTLQVNGVVGYVLTGIAEETPAPWTAIAAGAYNSVFTSSPFTKPSDEIWVFEVVFQYAGLKGYNFSFSGRYGSQTYQTGNYLFDELMTDGAGGGSWTSGVYASRWVVPAGTAITSDTLKIDTFAANGSQMRMFQTSSLISHTITTGTLAASKFRIYKYKTA